MERELVSVLPLASTLFLVRFIGSEAVYQRAKTTGRGLTFPSGIGLRLTFRLGGPLMLYATYKMLSQAASNFDRVVSLAIAILALGCLVGEPGTIRTARDGIVHTRFLGLRKTRIAWIGATASYVPGLREVLVVGSDGKTITHSQYHVGQRQFLAELKRNGVYIQGADPHL